MEGTPKKNMVSTIMKNGTKYSDPGLDLLDDEFANRLLGAYLDSLQDWVTSGKSVTTYPDTERAFNRYQVYAAATTVELENKK